MYDRLQELTLYWSLSSGCRN